MQSQEDRTSQPDRKKLTERRKGQRDKKNKQTEAEGPRLQECDMYREHGKDLSSKEMVRQR